MPPPERIRFLGDRLILVELGNVMDAAVNARVHACARLIEAADAPGLRDVVPAISTLGVHLDPRVASAADLLRIIERAVEHSRGASPEDLNGEPPVSIPVCYGGAFGPDLSSVAAWAGMTEEEVCERHASPTYRVFMIGFSPGFAYLGPVDASIAMPRLETPRLRVPAGSVGIAGPQTGIYPRTGPGGWRVIGRTPLRLFDAAATPPARLRPGQAVRFVPISSDELEATLP